MEREEEKGFPWTTATMVIVDFLVLRVSGRMGIGGFIGPSSSTEDERLSSAESGDLFCRVSSISLPSWLCTGWQDDPEREAWI